MTTDTDRIIHMEATIAHQDRQIQDLSDMINAQWSEIERLKSRLERILSKIDTIESGTSEGNTVTEMAALEKPPHY